MMIPARLSGWLAAALCGVVAATGVRGDVAVRWMGQDGHDLVGKYGDARPSQIQDIRFVVTGLPARSAIASMVVHGEGDGEWKFHGPPRSWLAEVVRPPGATTADVYVEPYRVETGRVFHFDLTFDDGRTITVRARGGKADPNLRVASARVLARWIGQDGGDRATSSANVGPDGVQDVHLALERLDRGRDVRSILIAGPGAYRWQAGPNREGYAGAEFVRDAADRGKGDLYFHPAREVSGRTLLVRVTYDDSSVDAATVKAGDSDPALHTVAPSIPTPIAAAISATWKGQGADGRVSVELDGLPPGRIVAAALGDGAAGWTFGAKVEFPDAKPLAIEPKGDAKALLMFTPVRNETDAAMLLRLDFDDGRTALVDFEGGAADPALTAQAPAATSVRARPGDDLNDLANRHGEVALDAGTYRLSRPLTLNQAVTIRSDGGATLLFDQGDSEPPWTAAIKIHAGRTTLDHLTIRFARPVRWDRQVSYGPAVIGVTDDRDRATGNTLAGLNFRGLDVEGPPPSAGSTWEEAPRLMRLVAATCGTIENNTLKGGSIEVAGGPWRVAGNRHQGTHAGSFSYTAFAVHWPRDVAIVGNLVKPLDPGGKTWRFLVATHRGSNLTVADNQISRVGPREGDSIPHPNAPETILTEAYRLEFEGKPAGVSPDGRTLAISAPQGEPPRAGSIVAILSGPQAGQWRRIVVPVAKNMYRLDAPVDLRGGAISILPGFVSTVFERNVIDDRGGGGAAIPLVLAGGHFGTRVVANRMSGGGLRAVAAASERPVHWGWSHTPVFGLAVEGGVFEDATAVQLTIDRGRQVRTTDGRVYFTANVASNTIRWSEPFLAALLNRKARTPSSIEVGEPGGGDPRAIVVTESSNRRIGGAARASIVVDRGTLNGRVIEAEHVRMPGDGDAAGSASSFRPRR